MQDYEGMHIYMTGVPHQQADQTQTDQRRARNGWKWNHASINVFRLLSKSSEKALINEQPVAAAVKTILDINMH
jgi:hypothetical protein